jgi:predicted nucleic acid-binding protein
MAGVILDTGPLVALLDRREKYHSWATSQLPNLSRPLMTCEAVLTEAFFLVSESTRASQELRTFLRNRVVVSDFNFPESQARVLELMDTYDDVPMSFADACLVCMVEKDPGSTLFTLDRDFTVYRQQRRRLIRLLAPF